MTCILLVGLVCSSRWGLLTQLCASYMWLTAHTGGQFSNVAVSPKGAISMVGGEKLQPPAGMWATGEYNRVQAQQRQDMPSQITGSG